MRSCQKKDCGGIHLSRLPALSAVLIPWPAPSGCQLLSFAHLPSAMGCNLTSFSSGTKCSCSCHLNVEFGPATAAKLRPIYTSKELCPHSPLTPAERIGHTLGEPADQVCKQSQRRLEKLVSSFEPQEKCRSNESFRCPPCLQCIHFSSEAGTGAC